MILIESQFCPPTVLFEALESHEVLCIEKHEHYQKRSYRNRLDLNSVKGREGFSIPLQKGKNQRTPITEVRISYDQNWPKQLTKRLQNSYGKSPFYPHYIDEITAILARDFDRLYDLNMAFLQWILQCLQSPVSVCETENYHHHIIDNQDNVVDYRNKIVPQSILETSKDCTAYSQVYEAECGFVTGLSILDLLFCYGPESRAIWRAERPAPKS